jgi:hypothetical protein
MARSIEAVSVDDGVTVICEEIRRRRVVVFAVSFVDLAADGSVKDI